MYFFFYFNLKSKTLFTLIVWLFPTPPSFFFQSLVQSLIILNGREKKTIQNSTISLYTTIFSSLNSYSFNLFIWVVSSTPPISLRHPPTQKHIYPLRQHITIIYECILFKKKRTNCIITYFKCLIWSERCSID